MQNGIVKKTGLAFILCVALVVFSYFYVDRTVANFVYYDQINQYYFLKWFTYLPPILQTVAPIILFGMIIVKAAGHNWNKAELVGFAMAFNVTIASLIKNKLKYVCGRYWPETWTNNNLSWIHDHAYGFHLFQGNNLGMNSFPSGHTTLIFAAMSIIWIAYPKLRWFTAIMCASVIIGLIGMDYHFVSDVIAGAFLGSITGAYTAHFLKIKQYNPSTRVLHKRAGRFTPVKV